MINIDDIVKRSNYIRNSLQEYEYNKYHNKTNLLLESNNKFDNIKFILQHWQSIDENQTKCFETIIDLLEESYENNNINEFKYIKSYILNEVTPTVRNAKESNRYLKYKITRMKNKTTEKVKNNVQDIKDTAKKYINNTKNTNSKAISDTKDNIKKGLGNKEVQESYIQILDSLDKYNHCDRIIENANTIQKRFNIMNMVNEVNINNDHELSALIDSICECVNTYNSSFGTRFNSAIETSFYFLNRTRKSFNESLVLEQIVNNFISKDYTDNDFIDMKFIIESSVIIDTDIKKNVEYIYNNIPFKDVSELASPFKNNPDTKKLGNIIESVSNIMTDRDVSKILESVNNINIKTINEKSINCLINELSKLYTGEDFNKIYFKNITNESILQGINLSNTDKRKYTTNIEESTFVMDLDILDEAFEKTTNTVKDIIDSFKLIKLKKSTDVRTCVSKMFTKSPDQIIDGTPNFLSWVRLSYVIGATAIHPVLGAITLLVDQFIAMKLKRRDIAKMITVFKNEQKNVAEKMKKVDEQDKKNLKEYDKYLKNGIDKLKEYEESLLTDNEINARDIGEEYDKSDELSFLKDDDDFELEATSFERLVEKSDFFSTKYFTNNIKKSINIMNEDTIDTITNIACKYPYIISKNGLYSILKEELDEIKNQYSDNKNWVRMSCLTSNIRKLNSENNIIISDDDNNDVFTIINGLEDLFIEYSISKSLTNESASGNIKLLSNKLRKTMQKASDIDKEASRKIDSSINMFVTGMQRAVKNENREAIIKGSVLPSASKIVKAAILDTGVALVNPAIAIILAVGQFALSKKMKKKERQLVLDEIEIEIEMCKRYLRQAEDQNDLEAQKKILRIQRNLERQKQRIQYNMKIHWNQDVPNVASKDDL